jgi:hypothetical protein
VTGNVEIFTSLWLPGSLQPKCDRMQEGHNILGLDCGNGCCNDFRPLCPVLGRQPTLCGIKGSIGDNREIIVVIEVTELHDIFRYGLCELPWILTVRFCS